MADIPLTVVAPKSTGILFPSLCSTVRNSFSLDVIKTEIKCFAALEGLYFL
jgi:hypothetical protein